MPKSADINTHCLRIFPTHEGLPMTSNTTLPMNWKLPLIAILRGITPDEVLGHAQVLIDAGFEAIEIPTNSPEWATSVEKTVKKFGHQALIGAGTVTTWDQVDQLAAMSAQLVVAPNTNPGVISRSLRRQMLTIPGCVTPTEAFVAIEAGAKHLKFFPAGNLGAGYLRSMKAVLPQDVSIYAVGGVTPENLHEFLEAGCVGAGLGSELYSAGQAAARTADRAREFVEAWRRVGR